MSNILNFLFASFFFLIISLAVFLPLPLMKLASPNSASLVLGQSTSSEQIQVSQVSLVQNSVVTLVALAYPDQKTYYHKIFKVKNSFTTVKKYKLEALSVLPEDHNLSVQVYFESADQSNVINLNPGEEKEVSLVLALGLKVSRSEALGPSADGKLVPRSYTLKILILSLD